MLTSNSNIPFFFDTTLANKYKVFGQILYIYFDPTFRRYVSVIDVGLKQKATIFTDELFFYRRNFTGNNFQFIFLKKKDTFSLKPVHFLNSKNERVLKKRYLSLSDNKFSFLNLSRFSFLNVKYLTFKNENLLKFKNENLLNFILLKSFNFSRLLKSYKFYVLSLLNFYKNLKGSKHKIYKILPLLILLKSISLNFLNVYQSLLYLYCSRTSEDLSKYFFWLDSFKNKIIKIFIYQPSSLNLKKVFGSLSEPNTFFKFKEENNVLRLLNGSQNPTLLPKNKLFEKQKKLKKKFFFNKRALDSSNKFYFRMLNENSNLFSFSNPIFEKLNKLEFSFRGIFSKYRTTRFNFLNSHFDAKPFVNRKLRTRNYFSILSKGRAYALVNKFSFLNTFSYGFFLRRRVFKNWLKFLIYFEKLNYLLILNNEEISIDNRFSKIFFTSLIFPLIFNFRNLFFNLIKVFRILKVVPNKLMLRGLRYGKVDTNYTKFKTKFLGILLNFLFTNKKFNKIPRNLVLNFVSTTQKLNFKSSDFLTLNNSSLIKHFFFSFFNMFLDDLNYIFVGLKFNEKFTNKSLVKLLFVNFSLNFNSILYQKNQLEIFKPIENSKTYLNSEWVPVFKIFKSSRIVSKYAKKYRRRPNFSKRKKFKSNFKKRGNFLASSGLFFKPQKLFLYPFKSRAFDSNKWSSSIKISRLSPVMSRYGSYLNRLKLLFKKFKSKTRFFSFKVFKNRLNLNFDLLKNISSKNIYYQRLLTNSLPKTSRIKRSLRLLKFDKYIRKWDKNQFYSNFNNPKFIKKEIVKSSYKNNKFNNYSYNKKNTLNFKSSNKISNSKKPIYRQRFQKNFSR